MRVLQLLFLSLIFVGCDVKKKQEEPRVEDLWFEYQLFRINEMPLKNAPENKWRLILNNPFNIPSYIYGIIEFEDDYLLYEKKVFKNGAGSKSFESEGILFSKQEFQSSWNKIIQFSHVSQVPADTVEVNISDGQTWLLEISNNSEYYIREGSFRNDSDFLWADTIFSNLPYNNPLIRYGTD